MASRRPNPQAIIEARRKEEEHRNSIQRGIDASNKARGFADWCVVAPQFRMLLPTPLFPNPLSVCRQSPCAFQCKFLLLPRNREVKSAAGFASRADQKRTREARERELANLEARRRSLAALLAADERQYKTELDALAETPEQARARLMAKAQGLKDARENARAALAQEKLTQRMRYVSRDFLVLLGHHTHFRSI